MILEVKFGKKINYIPLLICLASSIIIGYAIFLISNNISISLLLGVLCLIVIIMIYTLNLTKNYGYWEINNQGIRYSNLDSTGEKIKAILVPTNVEENSIGFDDIKTVQLIATAGIKAPTAVKESGALFSYSPDTVLNRFPSDYYLLIKLVDNQEVYLDLAASVSDTDNIAKMIELIEKGTQMKVGLVRQEN